MASPETADPGTDSPDIHLDQDQPPAAQSDEGTAAAREYDRRGILLPARARVGGIITPQ